MAISPLHEQIRRIVLSGNIKEDTAAVFLEQITALEYADVGRPISVYIDTYGGSVDAAILIYDAMRSCACPIKTFGIGKVMSAGVLILAAGDKGNRFITPNTRLMIHQVSGGAFGKSDELNVAVNEIFKLQDTYISLLSKHTGKSKSEIIKDIKTEKYMDAKEAVKYGIVDCIVEARKPIPENKKNKKVGNGK